MKLRQPFPRLYPIIDVACLPDRETRTVVNFAEELAVAGCTLLQYRNKAGTAREILMHSRELHRVLSPNVTLIMNDRCDLAVAAHFDGVHLGQDDLSPESARSIIGRDCILGLSTHNPEQLAQADQTSADYLAVGPIFATQSKHNPDPVVGLEGIRRARSLTPKILVAIGGIKRSNACEVIEAGADSVAVIADLLASPRKSAEAFLYVLK